MLGQFPRKMTQLVMHFITYQHAGTPPACAGHSAAEADVKYCNMMSVSLNNLFSAVKKEI